MKKKDNFETAVDIGYETFVDAKVTDTRKVFVNVGYSFFLEFTPAEALKFIDKKIRFLQDKLENCEQAIEKMAETSADRIIKEQKFNVNTIDQGFPMNF